MGDKKQPDQEFLARMSKPNKRFLVALWENHARVLRPEKREALRLYLQELYALTPEEVQKYFNRFKTAPSNKHSKKKWKLDEQDDLCEEERCYLEFQKLFIKGMQYANSHQVPQLVSPRLRNMSNIILGQLCLIRKVPVPKRTSSGKLAIFLTNLADWLAVSIEHLCYETRAMKIATLEEVRKTKEKNTGVVTIPSMEAMAQNEEGE